MPAPRVETQNGTCLYDAGVALLKVSWTQSCCQVPFLTSWPKLSPKP
jgi:hypothetical protein